MLKPKHQKWTSIDHFRGILHGVQTKCQENTFIVKYASKVKLHGTNAGIQFTPDGIFPQKRSAIITAGHFGFYEFVIRMRDTYPENYKEGSIVTLHGEWCGEGIHKRSPVACGKITEKFFAIFAVEKIFANGDTMFVEHPALIEIFLGKKFLENEQVKVIPHFEEDITVDFRDSKSMDEFIKDQNAKVDAIDACDPYIKAEFGVEGTGEGLVFFPTSVPDSYTPDDGEKKFMMKLKGESHTVSKVKDRNNIDVEKLNGINDICKRFATEARLEQGVHEVFGEDPVVITRMSEYIKWVSADVHKEHINEIADGGFEWEAVNRHLNRVSALFLKGLINAETT